MSWCSVSFYSYLSHKYSKKVIHISGLDEAVEVFFGTRQGLGWDYSWRLFTQPASWSVESISHNVFLCLCLCVCPVCSANFLFICTIYFIIYLIYICI